MWTVCCSARTRPRDRPITINLQDLQEKFEIIEYRQTSDKTESFTRLNEANNTKFMTRKPESKKFHRVSFQV